MSLRRFDSPRLTTQATRTPIEIAQAVEDSATNPELRVRLELYVLRRVVLFHSFDQAEHAGLDEVIERDVVGQPLMNSLRDVADLRQLLHEELFTLLCVQTSCFCVGL